MRVLPALALLLLAGCSRPAATPDPLLYRDARDLLRAERYREAEAKTEAALRRVPVSSTWYAKFRLLRAEILLARREAREANAALDFPPPAPAADLARFRLCQGYAAALLHDYTLARSRLEEAREMARPAGDETLLAEIELRTGYVAVGEGRHDEAAAQFAQVREVAIRRHDPYLLLNATGNLGYLLLKSFRYAAAIPQFEETLAAAQALGASESQARCLGNLGWCYYRLGNYDKALGCFQQADRRFEDSGNRYERQLWLGNIGGIFVSRGEYGGAADYYHRALDVARALGDRAHASTWLNNLALISIETGDLAAASRYNDEALLIKRDLNDTRALPYSVINAGRIALAKGDAAGASASFRSVLQKTGDDPSLLLDAHAGLAAVYARAGRDRAAEAEFRATISALERQRSGLVKSEYKLTWFASLIRFYRAYVSFLLARGDTRAALEVADSSRARLLADRLGLRQPLEHTSAARYRRIARDSLSTLLFYWLAPEGSCLWAISGDAIAVYPLPGEAEMARLVEAHRQPIEDLEDPLDSGDPAGLRLYALLIAPAESALRKTRRVILLPDGPLYSLNFETLPVSLPQPHYWIEDAAVSVTPSLRLLAPRQSSGKAGGRKSLLLIGNPAASGPEFPALPFAGEEMAAVESSLPAFRQVVRSGADAGPAAYAEARPGTFSLIHFVAHSAANREEPLQSAIILSSEGGNSRLLARDVMSIPIQAELVTVSSCRSAASTRYAGEGLVGLSWAFLQAGARNVIASLWDVNDGSSATLMSDLYRGIANGGAPSAALREAKLDMIHSGRVWRKPWYWAPFQLYTVGASVD